MKKFKCEKCSHEAEVKGFCPVDGSELKEIASTESKEVESLLAGIKSIVDESVKQYQVAAKDVHDTEAGKAIKTPHEYVKGLMTDNEKAQFVALSGEDKKDKFLSDQRTAYFFKSLVKFATTKDPIHQQHVKALAQGVDADGGYLVPTEFRAQLIEDLLDANYLRSFVTVIPMSSNSLELPTLLSSVKTSWGSENTAISTTTARFGTLTFTPYRLNTMIYTSRELVNDSAIGVIQLLVRLIREAIGREEDRVIVNGSGSGQPKGIFQETIAGIDNANVDADLAGNIKRLPFRLGQAYRRNARWLVNSLSMGHISALADTNGQFLLRAGLEAGAPGTLVGYPISEQNDMALDTLLFGDFSQYFLADREQITVETTTEGAGTFEKHQVAIKVVERIDGKVAQVRGFRQITNAGID